MKSVERGRMVDSAPLSTLWLHSNITCGCGEWRTCCSPHTTTTTANNNKRFFATKNDKPESTIVDPTLDNVTVISPEDAKLAMDAVTHDVTTGLTNLPGTGSKSGQKKLAIVFTCTVCHTRSAKQFTEQAYRKGVVLVRCPGCENLHLIADRLGVFEDQGADGKGWDIEKAMANIGENVTAVNNDNVLELTVQDVVGTDKMNEILNENGENEKR
jgi:protein import protein ZIM17